MKLEQAIKRYVEQKRFAGIDFSGGSKLLSAFCLFTADIPVSEIRQQHVLAFLDRPLSSTHTWRGKFGTLREFFLYWVARGELTHAPLPTPRPPTIRTFVPYIYTRPDLRRLLAASLLSQNHKACKIGARTFRTFLLFLYATGTLVGEGRRLRVDQVDLIRKRIVIRDSPKQCRDLPIGNELRRILKSYRDAVHGRKPDKLKPFFVTLDGTTLNEGTLGHCFQRARAISGIARSDGARYEPRMYDLRHTFAVHRITSWFRHGADMTRMLPALAVYLGQKEFASTEKYLKMVPDRFRMQLDILDPSKKNVHWRNNASLMRFLDAL